ncbi:MAG: beta-ketoacyl synthase N-terminal-like domain-containing protein [Candidatus Cryptobacteroides sp.]
MENRKAYIVSDCIVSPFGIGTDETVAALDAGRSAVTPRGGLMKDLEGNDVPVMCSLVPQEVCDALSDIFGPQWTRAELFALGAARGALDGAASDGVAMDGVASDGRALDDGSVDDRASGMAEGVRRAVIFSTTKGNISLVEGVGEDCAVPAGAFLWESSRRMGNFLGYADKDIYTISNACISGVTALAVARRLIHSGKYDSVLVVGFDALNEFIVSGFASFKSLSGEICRPYDASRCGLNLGEAAAAILLSERPSGGAVVLAGGSVSDDANHISGPSRTGDALFFAIRDAMSQSGIAPGDVSFADLHGTATVYNDEMESKALALAGLSDVPVQSFKPYIGHTLGASGVIEAVLCARELRRGLMWGTPGFSCCGTPFPVNACAGPRRLEMRHCVKTASGFGGCNAAVVMSLPESAGGSAGNQDGCAAGGYLKAACLETVRRVKMDNETAAEEGFKDDFPAYIREKYRSLGVQDLKFFKMDDMARLGYVASSILLQGLEYGPEDIAVLLSNSSASLDSDLRHQANLDGGKGASPAVFVYTLPNVTSGEISIRHKIKGENTFFISEGYDREKMMEYASLVLAESKAGYAIVGWIDYLRGNFSADLELVREWRDLIKD